jgi:hypothetical protein
MPNNTANFTRPRVDDNDLTKRLPLQMELMRLDTQLQDFSLAGEHADSRHRDLESRRHHVATELKKMTPRIQTRAPRPSTLPWHRGMSMHSHIAGPRFDLGTIGPWFGFSGTVRTGAPLPGISVFPPGSTGVIETLSVADSSVFFTGDIAALPVEGHPTNPGTFNDHLSIYFWLQNWTYVIPFPAPAVDSTLTYSFPVSVQVATVIVDRIALGWSYVSVGEATHFTGQEIRVDTGAAFPLVEADLNPPNGLINGSATVQRSFVVPGGSVPAVAVLVGFAAGLERHGEVIFDDALDCFILIGTDAECERVVDFRYDPLPPVALP